MFKSSGNKLSKVEHSGLCTMLSGKHQNPEIFLLINYSANNPQQSETVAKRIFPSKPLCYQILLTLKNGTYMLLEKPAPVLIAAEATLTEALRESFPTCRSWEKTSKLRTNFKTNHLCKARSYRRGCLDVLIQ